jgi:oxygen-dependent protoporphyrinogen oxidase
LGREALDRLVQPLAGGIYVGDPERLSMTASFARFREMELRQGSLWRGLRGSGTGAEVATGGVRYSLFASFRTGMGVLAEQIEGRLGEGLIHRAAVAALDRSGGRWRLKMKDGGEIEADAIVCAAPAPAAARFLAGAAPELSRDLAAIGYASSAVVNLAFEIRDLPRMPAGFGVVIPAIEGRNIVAISFSSLKFPGRAPHGLFLLRAFAGGALNARILDLDDDGLVAAVRDELRTLLDIRTTPRLAIVTRWPGSMPQYHVGHLERVERIEREAARLENFAIAGAALRGVGIPDCIRGASRAAESVFATLVRPD